MELINRAGVHIAVMGISDFYALDQWPLCGSRSAATEPIMNGSNGPEAAVVGLVRYLLCQLYTHRHAALLLFTTAVDSNVPLQMRFS